MRNPIAYDTLIAQLAREDLCANAIEALADLGDPRANAHIQPFLKDNNEAWPEDNHGPMLYVRDIAAMAIQRLSNPKHPDNVIRQMAVASPPPLPPGQPAAQHRTISSGPRRSPNFLAYAPLALALVELPWFAIVMFQQLFRTGTLKTTRQQTHLLDFISAIPALAGLVIGVLVFLRSKKLRWWEMLCTIIGMIGCGLFTASFGGEFFH